jgi:hypothetical protein
VKEKYINASISLSNFDNALPGPQAFGHDGDGDWGEGKRGVRAIISRAFGKDRANFNFSRASRKTGAPSGKARRPYCDQGIAQALKETRDSAELLFRRTVDAG